MSDPIRVGFLRGIVMRAPSITGTTDFYTELWGLKVARSAEGVTYLRGTGEEPFIYGLKDGDSYGIEYVHFGMDDRAEMDALYDHVTAKGAQTLGKPAVFDDPIGGYGFEVLDPDHRRLRFTTDLEMKAQVDEYAYPRKVSHVVLNTPDMDGLEKWYQDILGFRTSDYSADMMVFMRCNRDHHSIALVRAQYPSVNHVAFEMPDLDSFMRGIGRMKQKGQVPSWGPGRHGPGNNPFAYFVSPSGFVIEFTAELQQIDEETHEAKVWSRTDPDSMDRWMTAGPPTPAQRAVMAGRPDAGFPDLAKA
ncbi:VOC family protein [Limimaricola cinnabarinus]|jgi:catechol 2,3-dioxygenase-like lactoylglutathione lyase family enzyme|uniref:Glyoxalase n=1 Tax=Limimaricola cinnabarinus TaxID=1125964 RepID=A0A2G1MG38_9RHOB|nr:VOC family protein [Limimaricola cinnabarinus]PHP27696.1 glyoxalase [Limimaricola cinnabarinus]